MMIKDLPAMLERRIDYPAGPETVKSEIGETEIEAPDSADAKSIAELLDHVDEDTYDSPEELFDALVSYLPDAYIGRKFYDDRGSNPLELLRGEDDDSADRSF
jgi:hypothetical protein